jgi:hypothetical protein
MKSDIDFHKAALIKARIKEMQKPIRNAPSSSAGTKLRRERPDLFREQEPGRQTKGSFRVTS